jgi:CDP-paratose 2-epimerase
MRFQSLVIAGGAGFVGSNLAVSFRRRSPAPKVTVIDSLKRRGSELALPRLREAGADFVHGDIRCPDDLAALPEFDLMIDCSAEPSVQAGLHGSPRHVLDINLAGTINLLEAARQRRAAFLFLSTSRVYPIGPLNALPFREDETRFRWVASGPGPRGFSEHGIAEGFPLEGPRSFYGASKLSCELLIQEYVHSYGMAALIDRCGVLAGPWQMGKVDQGVVTLWVSRHAFGRPLRYVGFGGLGKQVRDILHCDDLFDLIALQLSRPEAWDGRIYNVGGGNEVSASLLELTEICRRETGREIPIARAPETSGVDLRIYVTDSREAARDFGWSPKRSVAQVVRDIHSWINTHRDVLRDVLG